jgi:phage FluMu protein Com
VQCDRCGKKLKNPNNDKILRVTCPLCKNTFNFQKGEKVQKATFIDPNSILESSRIIWYKKNACWLISAAVISGIVILFFALPDNKPRVDSHSVASSPPPVTSSPLTPELSKLEPATEKPIEKSSLSPIVPVEPKNPKRLPNGASPLGSGIRGGHSRLTLDNGTENDALVTLLRLLEANKKQQVRNFYIQEGRKLTTDEIPPGMYVLIVAFGKDWDFKHRRFNFRRGFSETEPFEISETSLQTEDGQPIRTRYTKMSLTLHKVFYGNFKSHEISEEKFIKILANSRP